MKSILGLFIFMNSTWCYAIVNSLESSIPRHRSLNQPTQALHNPNSLTIESSQAWKYTVNIEGCTGVVISPNHILTAAHCQNRIRQGFLVKFFRGSNPPQDGLRTDRFYAKFPQINRDDFDIHLHPTRDVALISIKTPDAIPFPTSEYHPIPVISHTKYLNNRLYVVGSGSNNVGRGDYLGFIPVRRTFSGSDTLLHQFDAYNRSQGVCGGDSGAPLITRAQNSQYALAGIVTNSHANLNSADNCGNGGHFVGIDMISDWLRQHRVFNTGTGRVEAEVEQEEWTAPVAI
jgi:hypothetical protein